MVPRNDVEWQVAEHFPRVDGLEGVVKARRVQAVGSVYAVGVEVVP